MGTRISVICPTYNRSTAILPTIESVLAQTIPDWELLVVSDASDDDTDDVVRGVGDDRVRLLRTGRHGSPSGPRNVGLTAACSPYVAYLDHDDRWAPTHLAVLLERLENGAALVSTGCVRIDHQGQAQERSGLLDRVWHPELQAMNAMYEPSRVGHVHPLVESVGGWNTHASGFEDWDLWFRLARRGHDFTTAPERTATIALHPASRRHTFGPRHAVGLAKLDDPARGRRVLDQLAEADVQESLRRRYLDDVHRWFEALAGSARFACPAHTTVDELVEVMRSRVAAGLAGSFLRELVIAPTASGHALALPTAPITQEHNTRIRQLLGIRHRAQLAVLTDLLRASR